MVPLRLGLNGGAHGAPQSRYWDSISTEPCFESFKDIILVTNVTFIMLQLLTENGRAPLGTAYTRTEITHFRSALLIWTNFLERTKSKAPKCLEKKSTMGVHSQSFASHLWHSKCGRSKAPKYLEIKSTLGIHSQSFANHLGDIPSVTAVLHTLAIRMSDFKNLSNDLGSV